MTTLNDLMLEAAQIQRELIESEGEMDRALALKLDFNELSKSRKIDACAEVLSQLRADDARLKELSREYADAARARHNMYERLKSYIKLQMANHGIDELKGERSQFSLRPSKGSLKIDQGRLPEEYMRVVTSTEPDLERIRAAIDSGTVVPGAIVVPGYSLTPKPLKELK